MNVKGNRMVQHTELSRITDILLDPVLDYGRCRTAALDLHRLYYELTGFNEDLPESVEHISTPEGLAVGTYSAAFCVTDFLRTRNFLQAIHEAVLDRLQARPGEPVHLLYAGTGPFATLVTPLLTRFRPDQLQASFLEINPVSMQLLQRLMQELGAAPYIRSCEQANAATWRIPVTRQPTIIVSETMKPGLEKEPQVSIMGNLLSQCGAGTLFIPERIRVSALLYTNHATRAEDLCYVQELLELDRESALLLRKEPDQSAIGGQGISLVIPADIPATFTRFGLATDIFLYKRHRIGFNESSLTIPQFLCERKELDPLPARLRFRYEQGPHPGFRFTRTG